MTRLFVNGMASISPQPENIFNTGLPETFNENILPALDQDYKSIIKPMTLRRMSQGVKMALFCSKRALLEAESDKPDAILVGTGQGCMQDTEKFMENMLVSEEGLLSPTSFIQSTHNTVAGQIALDLNCNGPNMTFTQNSVSFESALLDAMLQITDEDFNNILVGGVDETSKEITGFQKLDGQIKEEKINNLHLFRSKTTGTIISEAAAFFILGKHKTPKSYAEMLDVEIFNAIDISDLNSSVLSFLNRNGLTVSEIDAVILGKNGDLRFDLYYDKIQKGLFSDICQIGFKHLVGENNAVSSYAFWLASKILKEQTVPEIFKLNTINCTKPGFILIYNQYLGRNHGLTLLRSI
ncbi:beta-ketoacyl synthase N-terminal-like domain-containing protein [Christiangramia sabulilitoris]|uniref:3-oxoacyl-ACP synthase n=1 Tax=Christiangramia sabulilitoris TaxID=2583991 RepID=A0A550I616_9FLAO|nr:beta-ketoacyl synthase N-terminal-like domain-containing protein [Christiangramia sabulilitoris]TRO66420.1 3-oxoacyl-ACP synthase [Christiangramia sabulilitoris]